MKTTYTSSSLRRLSLHYMNFENLYKDLDDPIFMTAYYKGSNSASRNTLLDKLSRKCYF